MPHMQIDTHIAIGDILTAFSILIGLIGAAMALGDKVKDGAAALGQFNQTMRHASYAELDRMYADILSLAIERPILRAPSLINSAEDRVRYDAYAYMVWNFLETVHDRAQDDLTLRDTWAPVIAAEDELHRDWFVQEALGRQDPGEERKFCRGFRIFIIERQWREADWRYRAAWNEAHPDVRAGRAAARAA